ncbi:MAG: hypothetical protein AAGG08_10740, partial [Actinomycetota bacterium]
SHERFDADLALTIGTARLRGATDRPYTELLGVRTVAGERIAQHRLGGLVAGIRDRLRPPTGPSALVAGLAGELQAFADAIRMPSADAPARIELGSARDGVATMAVIDAIRTSARTGVATAVTPPDDLLAPEETDPRC